jgi:hypothetical protein
MLKRNSASIALLATISVVSLLLLFLSKGVALVFLALLSAGLVYLFYKFDEKRLAELHAGEAERRRHAEEMAAIHMNTIESLAKTKRRTVTCAARKYTRRRWASCSTSRNPI